MMNSFDNVFRRNTVLNDFTTRPWVGYKKTDG